MVKKNMPPVAIASSELNAEKAVKALLKWKASQSHTEKPQLLEQDEFLYLTVSLKKIPQKRVNPTKIPLPHPLIDPSTEPAELCMFIDDRSKSGITKDAVSKKIKSENIPISKVIKLSKLKTDYLPFESKRKLCDSYDMFFADRRVIPLLPRLLGKQFFKKRKIPVPVNLEHKNWKEQIEKACSSAMLFLSTGTCCVVKVAKLSMGKKEIVENVIAAINGIAENVPSKWGNIRSFHLKLFESLSLPVYQAMPDLRLRILGDSDVPKDVIEEKQDVEVEEENKKMKKKKNKGRIHEVQYMDDDDIDDSNSGADRKDEIKKKKSAVKKSKGVDMKVKKDGDGIDDSNSGADRKDEIKKKKNAVKKSKGVDMEVKKDDDDIDDSNSGADRKDEIKKKKNAVKKSKGVDMKVKKDDDDIDDSNSGADRKDEIKRKKSAVKKSKDVDMKVKKDKKKRNTIAA